MFYRNGVAATGLREIAAAAGVTRRTLYYHFASKEALVAEYLRRRDEARRAMFDDVDARRDPHAAVARVFESLDRWFRTSAFRGCALTNAVAENGETIVFAGTITARHKRAILDWFRVAAEAAGAHDPAALSEQLMLLFDGALTSARTRRQLDAASHAAAAAKLLFAAHGR